MSDLAYALFDTVIGTCAVVWRSDECIVGFQLPERNEATVRHRIARAWAAEEQQPPPSISTAVDGICAHLEGTPDDLHWIALDLTGVPEFNRSVYDVARSIPPGETLTYGQVAARIGAPGAAQAVGQALGHNPIPMIVPCHRVLAADGRIGGFSAYGSTLTKRRLLEIEQAPGFDNPVLF